MANKHPVLERRNCLSTLGLSEGASDDDIRKAYKRLALQYHPDKNPSNDAKGRFQEIGYAYKYLTEGPSGFENGDGDHDMGADILIRVFEDLFFPRFFTFGYSGCRPGPFYMDSESDDDEYFFYESDDGEEDHFHPRFSPGGAATGASRGHNKFAGPERPAFTQHEPSKKQQRKREKRARQKERAREKKSEEKTKPASYSEDIQDNNCAKQKDASADGHSVPTADGNAGQPATPTQTGPQKHKKSKKQLMAEQRKREQEIEKIGAELREKQRREEEKRKQSEAQAKQKATPVDQEEEEIDAEILGWFENKKKSRRAKKREKQRQAADSAAAGTNTEDSGKAGVDVADVSPDLEGRRSASSATDTGTPGESSSPAPLPERSTTPEFQTCHPLSFNIPEPKPFKTRASRPNEQSFKQRQPLLPNPRNHFERPPNPSYNRGGPGFLVTGPPGSHWQPPENDQYSHNDCYDDCYHGYQPYPPHMANGYHNNPPGPRPYRGSNFRPRGGHSEFRFHRPPYFQNNRPPFPSNFRGSRPPFPQHAQGGHPFMEEDFGRNGYYGDQRNGYYGNPGHFHEQEYGHRTGSQRQEGLFQGHPNSYSSSDGSTTNRKTGDRKKRDFQSEASQKRGTFPKTEVNGAGKSDGSKRMEHGAGQHSAQTHAPAFSSWEKNQQKEIKSNRNSDMDTFCVLDPDVDVLKPPLHSQYSYGRSDKRLPSKDKFFDSIDAMDSLDDFPVSVNNQSTYSHSSENQSSLFSDLDDSLDSFLKPEILETPKAMFSDNIRNFYARK